VHRLFKLVKLKFNAIHDYIYLEKEQKKKKEKGMIHAYGIS